MTRIGSLFSGYEGLTLGVQSVLPGRTAWVADIDPGPRKILAHRYPGVPNLGDVTKVDWTQVEPVDVITGGSPCQDVSHAGRRAGMRAGTRSGLWAAMCDTIDILRPRLVVWENVKGVLSAGADSGMEPCPICVGDQPDVHLRALGRVVGDLAELGYDARWCGLRAADVGAPHGRFRVFVAAWPAADADDYGHQQGHAGRHAAEQSWTEGPSDAAEDTDGPARGERWITAPGQEARRWTRAHPRGRGGAPLADTVRCGCDGRAPDTIRGEIRGTPSTRRGEISSADGDGPQGVRRVDTSGCDSHRRDRQDVAWGAYEPAVRRWEHVLGRPAPPPTEPGKNGPRLAARFVEWMMGLPDGWVCDVPGITRREVLKALGNGVVPQQAAAALTYLLNQEQQVAAS